ncbi:MAG: hypothetical protein K8R54_13185 [Bacteroidales bacterium]|nr:hypothetical protein [Bacteroidales bacterium]
MSNVFKEIEKSYKVFAVKIKDEQIWPWLRLDFMYLSIKEYTSKKINRSFSIRTFKEIFYGFTNWFSGYHYLVFSSSNQRVRINNRMFDKSVDFIIDELGKKKCLYIEFPDPNHFSKDKCYTKKIASYRFIELVRVIFRIILKFSALKIEREDIINAILKDYNLKLRAPLKELANRFYIDVRLYTLILRMYKPKAIFVNNAYGKMAIVYAANKLGIKTIEIQHGLIGRSHPAYNSTLSLDTLFYPSAILLNGKNDGKWLNKSGIYKNSELFTVGSFYLDYINRNFSGSSELRAQIEGYKTSVGVSLQLDFELELIGFIKKVAHKLSNVAFILIPRGEYKNDISNIDLPPNIITSNTENFYQTIKHCNYHTTIYSTCALEVPSLQVSNILYNYNNLSQNYFADTLNSETTIIVNDLLEYVQAFAQLEEKNKTKIDNSINFIENYELNIRKVLRHLVD